MLFVLGTRRYRYGKQTSHVSPRQETGHGTPSSARRRLPFVAALKQGATDHRLPTRSKSWTGTPAGTSLGKAFELGRLLCGFSSAHSEMIRGCADDSGVRGSEIVP